MTTDLGERMAQCMAVAETMLGDDISAKTSLAQHLSGLTDAEIRDQFTSGGPASTVLVTALREFQAARGF